MTREEAIKTLKEHKIMFQHDFGWDISTIKALDMAISALSVEGDLISRQAVLAIIKNSFLDLGNREDSNVFCAEIKALSSVENKGEWQLGGYDDIYYICSKCGFKASEYYSKPKFNFCPNCGAKMKGVSK